MIAHKNNSSEIHYMFHFLAWGMHRHKPYQFDHDWT